MEHKNYTFNTNGTLSYYPKRTVVHVPERSIGDPKMDIISTPNIALLGASSAAAKMSFFAALAISTLTSSLNSQPVLNLTVHDYLWGYEDPLVSLGANIIPSIITFDKLGILDRVKLFYLNFFM